MHQLTFDNVSFLLSVKSCFSSSIRKLSKLTQIEFVILDVTEWVGVYRVIDCYGKAQ